MMDHESHVAFVDAHPKRDGRANNLDFALVPVGVQFLFVSVLLVGVIETCAYAPVAELIYGLCDLFSVLPNRKRVRELSKEMRGHTFLDRQ